MTLHIAAFWRKFPNPRSCMIFTAGLARKQKFSISWAFQTGSHFLKCPWRNFLTIFIHSCPVSVSFCYDFITITKLFWLPIDFGQISSKSAKGVMTCSVIPAWLVRYLFLQVRACFLQVEHVFLDWRYKFKPARAPRTTLHGETRQLAHHLPAAKEIG